MVIIKTCFCYTSGLKWCFICENEMNEKLMSFCETFFCQTEYSGWLECFRGWRGSVGGILLLLLLFLLKYYLEEKYVEWLLLKPKWKNDPNRFKQRFKRRAWLEKQTLACIVWTGKYTIILIVQNDYSHEISSTSCFRCRNLEQINIKFATIGIAIHY